MFRMFRKNLVVAGASAVLLAAVATPYAQAGEATLRNLELRQETDHVVYATEVFGTGSESTSLQATGMRVTLTVEDDTAASVGARGHITFTLSGDATFGSAIDPTALRFTDASGGTAGVSSQLEPGTGALGSKSVRFNMTVSNEPLAERDTFVFNIPSITNAAELATAGEEIDVAVTTGVIVSITGQNFGTGAIAVNATETVVATSAQGLNLSLVDGVDEAINLTMRTVFAGGAPNVEISANITASPDTRAATLGTLRLTQVDLTQSVAAPPTSTMGDGGADIEIDADDRVEITVRGRFNPDDTVFLDVDADMTPDATGERFMINEAGDMAMVSLPGNGNLHEKTIYYVPTGGGALTPSTFSVSAAYRFADAKAGYADRTAMQATATETQFSGLAVNGWALATPSSGGRDAVEIRLTNEDSTPTAVFVDGYSQSGMALGFVELLPNMLGANSTETITAYTLESVYCQASFPTEFNMETGRPTNGGDPTCWDGRARFDFYTQANISVQVFQRGPDGNLRNMASSTGLKLDLAEPDGGCEDGESVADCFEGGKIIR